jgi:hypothetical protein
MCFNTKLLTVLSLGIALIAPAAAKPLIFQTLYTFTGVPDGGHPGGLVFDNGGDLFGTTGAGGANNSQGTVFKLIWVASCPRSGRRDFPLSRHCARHNADREPAE